MFLSEDHFAPTLTYSEWEKLSPLIESNNDLERRIALLEHPVVVVKNPDQLELPLSVVTLATCKCNKPVRAIGWRNCLTCDKPVKEA